MIVYQCSDKLKGRIDPTLGHARPRVNEKAKKRSGELLHKWQQPKKDNKYNKKYSLQITF